MSKDLVDETFGQYEVGIGRDFGNFVNFFTGFCGFCSFFLCLFLLNVFFFGISSGFDLIGRNLTGIDHLLENLASFGIVGDSAFYLINLCAGKGFEETVGAHFGEGEQLSGIDFESIDDMSVGGAALSEEGLDFIHISVGLLNVGIEECAEECGTGTEAAEVAQGILSGVAGHGDGTFGQVGADVEDKVFAFISFNYCRCNLS